MTREQPADMASLFWIQLETGAIGDKVTIALGPKKSTSIKQKNSCFRKKGMPYDTNSLSVSWLQCKKNQNELQKEYCMKIKLIALD